MGHGLTIWERFVDASCWTTALALAHQPHWGQLSHAMARQTRPKPPGPPLPPQASVPKLTDSAPDRLCT